MPVEGFANPSFGITKTKILKDAFLQHHACHSILFFHCSSLGEKAFPCQHCPRKFKTLPEMRVHQKVHSSDKPFTCNVCDSSFPRQGKK